MSGREGGGCCRRGTVGRVDTVGRMEERREAEGGGGTEAMETEGVEEERGEGSMLKVRDIR